MHIPSCSRAAAAAHPRPGRGGRRFAALATAILLSAGAALPAFAQAYVTQYTAAFGPVGEALDTVGGVTYLYVADESHGNVVKINVATGATVATFGSGSQGSAAGQFGRPYGIAVDPTSHDLYVTERLNGRVQRINSTTGASIMMWGTDDASFDSAGTNTNPPNPTSPQGHFQEPIGVAVDSAGHVYVVDHGNNRVQEFLVHQVNGAWTADNVKMWGTTGSGNGQFDHPYGATLDSAGNLWVADGLNGRVQKFDANGNFLGTVGSKGTGAGQFVIATWVNFDASGALWVTSTNSNPQDSTAADINNQWVSKFTPSGSGATFVSRFGGTYGANAGELKLPFDAVVDASNKAYVSDYYNSRVQVFDLNAAPTSGGTTSGGTSSGGTSTGGTTTGGSTSGGTSSGGTTTGGTSTGSTSTGGTTSGGTTTGGTTSGGTSTGGTTTGGTSTGGTSTGTTSIGGTSTGTSSTGGVTTDDNNTEDSHVGGTSSEDDHHDTEDNHDNGDGKHGKSTAPGQLKKDAKLVNLSSRMTVKGHDVAHTVIVGFVVSGTTPQTVLVRAVGPGLRGYGIGDALSDPTLVVHNSAGALIASNSGWDDDAKVSAVTQQVGAFALMRGSHDAAMVLTLPPGAYTATVEGTKGTALIEVYDADTGTSLSGPELVNISTRGYVDAGGNLISGLVVRGTTPQHVLVRAVGPGLTAFGVTGALADPVLEVHDASGATIARNDNWETPVTTTAAHPAASAADITAADSSTGAFPLASGSKDAAVVLTLDPGSYSVVVTGAANSSGAVLVEVYQLP